MQKLENLSVLILAYNRFEKFNRCIKRLNEQGIKKIYLSIDGPRNKIDLKNQEKITSFCKNNNFDIFSKISPTSNRICLNYIKNSFEIFWCAENSDHLINIPD